MRKLVCFPFAGAGASFFRPWAKIMDEHFHVTAVQLPGRENRFAEAPYTSVEEAIDDLEQELDELLHDASEVVIFGHSLGAVLAYELALRLGRTSTPCRLVVSGSPAPTRPRAQRAAGLDDEAFLLRVRDFAGYSHPSLEDPEMRKLLVPMLRADVEMHEAYVAHDKHLLAIPVISIRGQDDELVTNEDAAHWHEVTRGPFESIDLAGGHMYLAERPAPLFDLLVRTAVEA
jgi:surfactin synthase thioesterase subunit